MVARVLRRFHRKREVLRERAARRWLLKLMTGASDVDEGLRRMGRSPERAAVRDFGIVRGSLGPDGPERMALDRIEERYNELRWFMLREGRVGIRAMDKEGE